MSFICCRISNFSQSCLSAYWWLIAILIGQCRYKLAEKVSDRLTEMSQDLSSMIEEINSVSATLSKTNKPDNPVSILQINILLILVFYLCSSLQR